MTAERSGHDLPDSTDDTPAAGDRERGPLPADAHRTDEAGPGPVPGAALGGAAAGGGAGAAWDDATDGGETASADDPRESAYGLLQRGHDLMRSRHHAQAATVLARAARLEPRKGSILEALGRAYYNSGQHEPAAETFQALLEVDPSAHYAHYALGQSLKQLGRLREARTHLRLAVALAPHSRLYQGALDRLGPAPKEQGTGPTD